MNYHGYNIFVVVILGAKNMLCCSANAAGRPINPVQNGLENVHHEMAAKIMSFLYICSEQWQINY